MANIVVPEKVLRKRDKMTNEVTVKYEGSLSAKVELPDGNSLVIGAPAGHGGCGDASPSPKDLFAAGYASCVAMTMDIAAKKNGFDIAGAEIVVSPVWAKKQPLLEQVNATVILPQSFSEEQLNILRNGAHNCSVHNSLRPEVKTTLTFEFA